MVVSGYWDLIFCWVERRVEGVRPRSAMQRAPEAAKEWAMEEPVPEPPPVMRMVLWAVERGGRRGEMEG